MTTTAATPGPRRAGPALAIAVVAVLPYLTLKGLWLSGSTLGLTPDAAAEMHSARFVTGNAITVVLELVALALAWSLTRPWAKGVPTHLFAVLAAGASGLLAPILVGMPLGQVAETVVHGRPSFDGEGMAPWVFACVYGGFVLLGASLAVLLGGYARERWGHLFTSPPRVVRPWTLAAGALGLAPFALAMLWWGLAGPGGAGPRSMDEPAQRTVLAVTGMLSLAAMLVPALVRYVRPVGPRRAQMAWLVLWLGCCTAALQGPTQLLLANGATIQPAVAAIALLATPAALVLALGLRPAQSGGAGG